MNLKPVYLLFLAISLSERQKSEFFKDQFQAKNLPNCDRYLRYLVRLPFYYELSNEDVADISR